MTSQAGGLLPFQGTSVRPTAVWPYICTVADSYVAEEVREADEAAERAAELKIEKILSLSPAVESLGPLNASF